MGKNNKSIIVRAAYDSFVENGYDNSSIKMIAERAAVSKGNIYNFFDSKELLFDDVLRMVQDNFKAKMIAVANEYKDASVEECINGFADAMLENREEAVFMISSALMPKLRGRTGPLLKEYSDGMIEVMNPLFPGLPEEVLYDIGNLLLAVTDSLLIDGDRERAVRSGVFAVKLLLGSLDDTAQVKKGV